MSITAETLAAAFGAGTIHEVPIPLRRKPRWWQFAARRYERNLDEGLAKLGRGPVTEAMRNTYWFEVRKGQGIREDAGGYFWRCWAVALGVPVEDSGPNYRDAIHDLRIRGGL